jgi:hypothetical protein
MKIFATGEVIHLTQTSEVNYVKFARVVGLIDLGGNNSENSFGWCGLKAVVNYNNLLFVLDFPEEAMITTNDDILIKEGAKTWFPALSDTEKFDLFLFDKDDY